MVTVSAYHVRGTVIQGPERCFSGNSYSSETADISQAAHIP